MNLANVPAGNGVRFVSRLTRDTLALILAGGRGSRLGALTDWRAKPAVPFGAKARIIDFALSNCVHSQIRRILVLTQYKSHSLVKHLLNGWGHLNSEHGEFLDVVPAQQWVAEDAWYRGTADAVYQCMDIVSGYGPKYVLILAGDHIYAMDYGEMLAVHAETGADVTIACTTVPIAQAREFGIMEVDATGRIIGFEEKPHSPKPMPGHPGHALVSMGIYVFLSDYLAHQLRQDQSDDLSAKDFGKNIIPRLIAQGYRVQAYFFGKPGGFEPEYWRDVGTVDAYFQANMELVSPAPPIDLHDTGWPILTYQPQLPPASFMSGGSTGRAVSCRVQSSIVANGCIVKGSDLSQTILSAKAKVHPGCQLENVVALPGCEIRSDCRLRNVILDNRCVLPEGTVIGEDPVADRARFDVTSSGVVVVTRQALGQSARYYPSLASGG